MQSIKLYRPSSGHEGEWFIREWCQQCERDKCQNGSKPMDECQPEDLCQIIGDTMFMDINDPDYPKEWVEDETGPRCTAFVEVGSIVKDKPCQFTSDLFGTSDAAAQPAQGGEA